MRPSRWLRLTLCAGLLLFSWPAAAVEHIGEIGRTIATALPVPQTPLNVAPGLELTPAALFSIATAPTLPGLPVVAVDAAPPSIDAPAAAVLPQAAAPNFGDIRAALPEAQNAQPSASVADAAAGYAGGARRFDGSWARKAAIPAVVVAGAGAAAFAARHSLHAFGPLANTISYDAANVLSVAFPLPETYGTFRKGNAQGFPIKRAVIGSVGTLALGLLNASVLGKPLWGTMHTFIALGMIAPYVIGKALEKRGGKPLSRGAAVAATAAVGAVMLALSAGLYAGAAALIPAYLAAHLSAAAVADLLLAVQIAKGALFVGAFAPDVADLIRGRPAKGFSKAFTSIYLASVAAFTLWGFLAAAQAPAGPIRDQYIVHGLRNLAETVASGLSLIALSRIGPGPKKTGPKSAAAVPVGPNANAGSSFIMEGSRNASKEVVN